MKGKKCKQALSSINDLDGEQFDASDLFWYVSKQITGWLTVW